MRKERGMWSEREVNRKAGRQSSGLFLQWRLWIQDRREIRGARTRLGDASKGMTRDAKAETGCRMACNYRQHGGEQEQTNERCDDKRTHTRHLA